MGQSPDSRGEVIYLEKAETKSEIVVITGGSSGIGAAVARVYAARRATVIIASPEADALTELARDLNSVYGIQQVLAKPADITSDEDVRELFSLATTSFGGIDVLVNCAGVGHLGWVVDSSLSDYESLFAVNFFGMLRCTKAALPAMLAANSGRIVNFASGAAIYGTPGMAAYSASKAAIATFSQALRGELRGSNVKVTVVYPDKTQTNFERNTALGSGFARRPADGMSAEVAARAIVQGASAGRRRVMLGKTKVAGLIAGAMPGTTERILMRAAKTWRA